ncbi:MULTISPECIES: peptidoglycan recognition protein family protein [Erwinia]|uniref:peptidoglycan recognition protein family protein n=1 Tax=Erwinia TaxID=551 RepID=UPI001331720B|nr:MULTISPECIES: peptidoglycan recognition family protein [Erwinia]MBP2155045.1 N-acetyl-anhydromuramyl-L-alanine amidase AmpD [Erwinia rhapontici]NNS08618.1 N-acetylmuramoyl-L-alanine amidase [Erwinia sp. JH02]
MLYIDNGGYTDAERIILKIIKNIERGQMDAINGIVVHQTDSTTANSTFNSYQTKGANGAHFLIDRDGTIYQTASLYQVTWHVGKIQSRCFITKKCEPVDLKKVTELERNWKNNTKISNLEKKKSYPDRFPNNTDSIGIEIVGKAIEVKNPKTGETKDIYEQVSEQQNDALKWLIKELTSTLNVSMNEIYRHPEIGRKNVTEASTAKW